jgi:hypothetical protein
MGDFWDQDIAAIDVDDFEKNGLQIFKNYQKAFDKQASQKFAEHINSLQFDLVPLEKILKIISGEDFRFLPVIFCSFADEQLEAMFRREIPESIPGGRSSILSGFGGLSRFSQRIQIAYAFDWMSRDLLEEANKFRKIRNDVSHSWDIEDVRPKLIALFDSQMHKIEAQLAESELIQKGDLDKLKNEEVLRVRLIWLIGRFYYESLLFPMAKKLRLDVESTLYSDNKPKLLASISKKCLIASRLIVSTLGR